MTKQLKCYYLLLIRYYKLSLLNQFLEGYSIMAAWGNNFFKKNFFLLFFHFSAPLKCHWPIPASSLKSHSPAGRIYSPLATGRVLMKRLHNLLQTTSLFPKVCGFLKYSKPAQYVVMLRLRCCMCWPILDDSLILYRAVFMVRLRQRFISNCWVVWNLQRYSQSRWSHGSQPLHDLTRTIPENPWSCE